ncbi:MAG: OmpA family protein [Gammaproteobacteria bacterium]|nr:OmpA family protein [Gammaproteobacteria bacterium]
MNKAFYAVARTAVYFSALLMVAFALPGAYADSLYKEAPGAKDHPLVSRFKGSVLYKYGSINFERVEIALPDKHTETMEGKLYNYYYLGPKGRGDLEVYRNYKLAFEQQHFKILWACEDGMACAKQGLAAHARKWTDDARSFVGGSFYMNNMDSDRPFRFLLARLSRPEGDVTVVLTVRGGYFADQGFDSDYFLQVIESAAMQQDQVSVNAEALHKGIMADGKVALYGIYFDTAKADIKPESKAQLDEMAKLLKQNSALTVFIVGHTDNQGTLEANIALSQRRADAVVGALVKDYKIDAKRLAAKGVANYAPVASQLNDAGRAKNRRVELVAQ